MTSNQLLFKFALRYPFLVLLTVILGFSGALFNGVSTTLVVPLVLAFLGQQQLNLQGAPPVLQKILSIFDGVPPDYRLVAMTGAVLFAIILKNICVYVSYLASSYLSRSLVSTIRKEAIQLLLQVDIDFYAKSKVGNLVNCLGQEVNKTANAIRIGVTIFTTAATILVFVWILIVLSWQLTLATTFLIGLVAAFNQIFVIHSRKLGEVQSAKSRTYSGSLIEMLTGIRLIKSVGSENREINKLNKLIAEFEEADLKAQANFAAIGPINEVSGIIVVLAIVFVGRALFLNELDSFSAILLTYLVVLFRLMPFVGQLNSARSQFANSSPSAEVVANFLDRDNKPFMSNGSFPYNNFTDGICLEGLSFAYPGQDKLALKNIDLFIPKGTTLALVGASGAGKSTLADLLPRFYDPTEGRITIDGKDLRDFDLPSIRKAMGIVSQDTFLFNDSIRNNIAYARPEASEEEIINALKRSNAYEFITQLPQGLDTEIGDRGVLLSGGQRQRMAIARALLRDPDILILDEATSALDTVSERLVQQAIDELCRDRTTVVIAHRLSTVQKANRIAVLEKGSVVEIGSHEELLNKNGYYSRLYAMQFNEQTQNVIQSAVNDALMKTSYQFRNHLTPMIGFLSLIVEDLVDNTQEQKELTDEAYTSAIRLLRTLEGIENQAKSTR